MRMTMMTLKEDELMEESSLLDPIQNDSIDAVIDMVEDKIIDDPRIGEVAGIWFKLSGFEGLDFSATNPIPSIEEPAKFELK